MNQPGQLIDHVDEQRRRETTREYLEFLDDSNDQEVYLSKVKELIQEGGVRLVVNLNDIRRKLPHRAEGLLRDCVEEIICLQDAVKQLVERVDIEKAKTQSDFFVGFEGSFGDRHVTPRSLKARFLGNLVCCEGIVTKCSLVRPKVVRSVHFCPATGKTLERRYTDLTSYDAFPSSTVYPTEDENKNPLETEYGLSVYKDHQTLSIQELPEMAPAGQLPRSVDIVADEDLADRCKPGDRVRIIGLFRCLPSKQQGYSNGTFRTIILASNILLMSKEVQPNFVAQDVANIRKMSRQKDVFNLLARSLAPSIHGHEEVKRAILCLLLGGNEKILTNGTRLRGDVNVLLIGDPSVAKSQLLRYVIHTAPRAIATTGRGSSGVGLTAAVTTDSETGERRLEAGAMVLGDRGIVCIDEFDKMTDVDRTAIHEVMEQGRVTIAKAGIHAKLNARCSVLAAANPVYGRYDLYKTPMENIGMQDSLLSRFDLLFVMLDEHDGERDKSIADHIVKLHRYRTPGEADGAVLEMGAAVESLTTFDLDAEDDGHGNITEVYEKNKGWIAGKQTDKIVSMKFMRKYIHMAKAVKPTLTEEAATYISSCYTELRSFDSTKSDRERTMPVTARQLETMIRLATAHAKARLAKTVDRVDAERAFHLLHFACFKEKPKERLELEGKQRRRKRAESEGESGEDENEEEDSQETNADSMDVSDSAATRQSRRRRVHDPDSQDLEESQLSTGSALNDTAPPTKKARTEAAAISVDRYKAFKRYVRQAFDGLGKSEDMVELNKITAEIQKLAKALQFTEPELEAAYEQLTAENSAMITDDLIMLI
uniref:DNA replication licensing factor MCM3 n=1 Tax=Plectus sambesii TaxID=2011161 RepID=A0A914WP22_9BILA